MLFFDIMQHTMNICRSYINYFLHLCHWKTTQAGPLQNLPVGEGIAPPKVKIYWAIILTEESNIGLKFVISYFIYAIQEIYKAFFHHKHLFIKRFLSKNSWTQPIKSKYHKIISLNLFKYGKLDNIIIHILCRKDKLLSLCQDYRGKRVGHSNMVLWMWVV